MKLGLNIALTKKHPNETFRLDVPIREHVKSHTLLLLPEYTGSTK